MAKHAASTSGEKFTDRYKVTSRTLYKGNTKALRIPGPNHPLYDPTAPTTFDPLRVEEIDKDGEMSTPIEVLSDPDEGILWIVDGRGRHLDVIEVNRRRQEEGRKLVEPIIVPFNGDEKAAIGRVRVKNYHRRDVTPSGMGIDIHALRKAGYSWDECARKLHVESADAKQWCKRLLPLAFCIADVRAAVDAGKIAQGVARKFGGTDEKGEKALGPKAQAELLAEMLAAKVPKVKKSKEEDDVDTSRVASAKTRERVACALVNGEAKKLDASEKLAARVIACAIRRLNGEKKALDVWPGIARIVDEVLAAKNVETAPASSVVEPVATATAAESTAS